MIVAMDKRNIDPLFLVLIRECALLVQYEPEIFPGLIYRTKQPKIVLLIFMSGKIVLTGAKVMKAKMCHLLNIGF